MYRTAFWLADHAHGCQDESVASMTAEQVTNNDAAVCRGNTVIGFAAAAWRDTWRSN